MLNSHEASSRLLIVFPRNLAHNVHNRLADVITERLVVGACTRGNYFKAKLVVRPTFEYSWAHYLVAAITRNYHFWNRRNRASEFEFLRMQSDCTCSLGALGEWENSCQDVDGVSVMYQLLDFCQSLRVVFQAPTNYKMLPLQ